MLGLGAYQTSRTSQTRGSKAHERSSSGIVMDWKSSARAVIKVGEQVRYPEESLWRVRGALRAETYQVLTSGGQEGGRSSPNEDGHKEGKKPGRRPVMEARKEKSASRRKWPMGVHADG